MSQVYVSGVDELPLFQIAKRLAEHERERSARVDGLAGEVAGAKRGSAQHQSARDDALARVEQNADEQWKKQALEAVRLTAERLPEFISDDVWETPLRGTEHLAPAREDRALGAVMVQAARNGWIRKTDRTRPSIRSHMSGKPVWVSKLRQPF